MEAEINIEAKPRGHYFEDFSVGQEFLTPARTITQTDIVNFACLSGDFNEVHTNFEYSKNTPFGEPVAHGPLVYAVLAGLQYATGINDGTLLALLQIDGWRMLAPVKHGDTIRLHSKVLEVRELQKGDKGIVTFLRRGIKQDGTVVQEMTAKYLYRKRPVA